MIDRSRVDQRPPSPTPPQAHSQEYLDFLARAKAEDALRRAPLEQLHVLQRIATALERLVELKEGRR